MAKNERGRALADFLHSLVTDPAQRKIFEDFMYMLDRANLTDKEREALLSGDLKKIIKLLEDEGEIWKGPVIEVWGWWRRGRDDWEKWRKKYQNKK
jgi:hypothetical protein